jgi:hypothetical protein
MHNGLEERMHEYTRESAGDQEAGETQKPNKGNKQSMQPQSQPPESPTFARVRIYSHVTQSKFIHIEDTLHLGKLRLFAGMYRRGKGMDAHANHFIDLPAARVIFTALANGEQGFTHREYKGTPPQGKTPAVSRVMSVTVKGDNVYIELKSGPGKLTPTGAITPDGKPEVEVNVSFKLFEARCLAATVLAYIQAWDVMRMMANRHAVSAPVTYLLVPSAGDGNGNGHSLESGNGDYRRNEATTAVPRLVTPPAVSTGSRPATNRNAVAAGVPFQAAANGGSAGIPFRGQVTRDQVTAVGVHPVAAPPVKASVAAPSSPAAGVKFDKGQNGVGGFCISPQKGLFENKQRQCA